MVDLEQATAVTAQDLATWYQLKAELARVKAAEAMLRSRIFKAYFPVPVEGTNTAPINDGTGAVVKATHVLNRAIDQGSLDALRTALTAEGSNLPKVPLEKLIKWTPEVITKAYRELTEEERLCFDQCLIIKPGSPQVEITIPKRAS